MSNSKRKALKIQLLGAEQNSFINKCFLMTLHVTVTVVSVGDTWSNKRQKSLGYMVIRDPFSMANILPKGQWTFPTELW